MHKYEIHPDEPDHSQPSGHRTMMAKQEREDREGGPVQRPEDNENHGTL
jgi:hypothetical protein